MKKRLKKRQRGKIAAILFVVVAFLFAAALVVLSNLKAGKQKPKAANNRTYAGAKNITGLNTAKNTVSLPAGSLTETYLPVSYPGLFSFYYA